MTGSASEFNASPAPATHPAMIERQLEHVVQRLIDDYAGRTPAATVRECVEEALSELSEVRVEALIPVLVDRQARRHIEYKLKHRFVRSGVQDQ
jgi:hypothetical protein